MKEFKGALEGYPEEVVNWMLDQQEAQGNKRDITIFEKYVYATKTLKGFDWHLALTNETKEVSLDFSKEVIYHRNFSLFFERFPHLKVTEECEECEQSTQEEIEDEKTKQDKIAVTTQLVCAMITSNECYGKSISDVVKTAIDYSNEIFKQVK